MTRSTLAITIGAVGIVGALVLGSALLSDHSQQKRAPKSARTATGERAPEPEDHRADDLPTIEATTRRFLNGYLPLIYGKRGASIDGLASASPRLIARLKAEGGHVTPAQAERTPRLQRVAVIKEGTIGALATAHIKDSPSPAYPLVFHLQKTPEGWVVTRIGGP
jgi:hypothetical protein